MCLHQALPGPQMASVLNQHETFTWSVTRRKGDSSNRNLHHVSRHHVHKGHRFVTEAEMCIKASSWRNPAAPTKKKGLVGRMLQALDSKDRNHGVLEGRRE